MCLLLYGLKCQLLTKGKDWTVWKPRLMESPVRVWILVPGSHDTKGKCVGSLKNYSSPEGLKSEEQLSYQKHDFVTYPNIFSKVGQHRKAKVPLSGVKLCSGLPYERALAPPDCWAHFSLFVPKSMDNKPRIWSPEKKYNITSHWF